MENELRNGKIVLTFVVIALVLIPLSYASILLIKPENNSLTKNTVNFSFSTQQNFSNCSLNLDNSFLFLFNNVIPNKVYSKSYLPSLGSHSWNLNCIEMTLNNSNTTTSDLFTFTFDNQPPEITIISPEINQTFKDNDVTLKIKTDESSECKMDSANKSFESMRYDFEKNDDSLILTLKELEDNHYKYFITCKDKVGNEESRIVEFNINTPLNAKIQIDTNLDEDGNFFLPSGRKKVNIRLSKNIEEGPIMYYMIGASKTYIPLTGSGKRFTGYIILDYKQNDKVGEFYLVYNNQDVEITEGRIFVIDSKLPPAPKDIRAELYDKKVYLKWYYSGEKVDFFKVYKTSNDKVDFLDFISKSNNQDYLDSSVEEGKTYYYKVTAVDQAGNEGDFSQVAIIKIPYAEPVKEKYTNEQLQALNSSKKKLNLLKINLETAKKNLENTADPKIVQFIKDYGLESVINDKLKRVQTLQTKLNSSLNIEETVSEVNQLEQEIQTVIVNNVKFKGESSDVQLNDDNTIKQISLEYLKAKGLDENNQDAILLKINNINKNIRVTSTSTVFSVEKMNGKKNYISLIQKQISYSGNEPLNKPNLIEYISKTVADSTDQIKFVTKNYDIIKKDPIISYNIDSLGIEQENIEYYVNSLVSETKNFKTIVIPTNLSQPKLKSSAPTGLSVSKVDFKKIIGGNKVLGYLAVVFISLLLYYFIAIKKSVPTTNKNNLKDERDINSLRFIMDQAHKEIDNLNYEVSKNSYVSVVSLLKHKTMKSQMSKEDAKKLQFLHKKLTVYLKINHAYSLFEKHDFQGLKEELNNLRKDILDFKLNSNENSKFTSYISHWYFHLQNEIDYNN